MSKIQREQILKHFERCDSLTTIEARSYYGILAPAPRIFELRQQGYDIVTIRETHGTHKGSHKRVARYVFGGGV